MLDSRKIMCFIVMAIVIVIPTFVSACRQRPIEPEQRYPIKGTVVSVDKHGATVTISHEEIPGYMEAMAMPFKLKDERLLSDMAEGDRVQATLVVAGLKSWLEDVVVTRETVDPSDIRNPQARAEPKPGDEVPDFKLINQDGDHISLHQYHGKTLVVTFIYTRCPLPDYCPLMTDNFSEMQKTLKSGAALYERTHLLSISVDPEYDTPKILREYAVHHSADTTQWEFATGNKEEVKQAATYFGMQYWRDQDQVVHSLRTAVIGADGKVVRLYHGNEWKPQEIVSELRRQQASD